MISGVPANQWAALIVALLAAAFDLRTRHIPNSLTFGGAGIAFGYALYAHGTSGVLTSVGGWLVGLVLFFPFFALGGLGAGDVKLAAAIGAWLSPSEAMWLALYAMIAGGVLGAIVALAVGYFRTATQNVLRLLAHWSVTGIRPLPEMTLAQGRGPRLPYAVPIFVGTLAVVLGA